MLNLHTLTDELAHMLGDHAEIECEIDNVQSYLDGVAARRKVAPDIGECAWLMLLGLYRADNTRKGEMTAAQVCAAVGCSSSQAIAHVTSLLKDELVCFQIEDDRPPPPLVITKKGSKIVSAWLSLMHLGARTPIAVTTTSIVSALETLARRNSPAAD
ncbi:MAG: hypothetical protein QM681_08800 [Novosphingobium sp.]